MSIQSMLLKNPHFAPNNVPVTTQVGIRPSLSTTTNNNNSTTAPASDAAAPTTNGAAPAKARTHRTRRHPLHLRVLQCPGLVYVVAPRHRRQVPAWADTVDTPMLFLCPYYNAASNAGCPYGAACDMVHADLSEATCHRVHEHCSSWSMLEDVPYQRHDAGTTYSVTPPNSDSTAPCEAVPSHHVIITNAVRSGRTPLSHCAHFTQKGVCDLGEDCRFAHVVRIGGVTDAVPTITAIGAPLPIVATPVASAATAVGAAPHKAVLLPPIVTCGLPSFDESPGEDEDVQSPAQPDTRPRAASGSGNSWMVSSGNASHTSYGTARFRHNPYAAVARDQHHHITPSASISFA